MQTYALRITSFATLALLGGCDPFNDALEDATPKSEATGRVVDNRGEPVAGVTIRLYDLLDNTDFVEGGDLGSAQAYIDREAVLASDNAVKSGKTDDDGKFLIENVPPTAMLAVATIESCSAGFAGFDEETGILDVGTLIEPDIDGKDLRFGVPEFVVACSTPPVVGPEGNSDEAPPYEPPPPVITCNADECTAAGGACDGDACVMGCASDEECEAGQAGAYCLDPGDGTAAQCQPPDPGEIVPPDEVVGWTGLRVSDSAGNLLADASAGNQMIAAAPADGLVRIQGDYAGAATMAYLHVQSGGQSCPNLPPRTDSFPVEIANGGLASTAGNWVELALHGGYQKIMLSTSATPGEGEQSFAVEIGEPCAPPAKPFTAVLSWEAGPGNPADLDINVWNGAGELVFVGNKQAAWGQLALEGKGPGPEVFEAVDVAQGPFTVKVQFFSGKPRDLEAKLRVIRTVGGQVVDDSFTFVVTKPKDVAEIGVFTAE